MAGKKSLFSVALKHLLLTQLFHCQELGWCPKVFILNKPTLTLSPPKTPQPTQKAPLTTKQTKTTKQRNFFSHLEREIGEVFWNFFNAFS